MKTEAKFKVGDKVKIIDCSAGQPDNLLGRIAAIESIKLFGSVIYLKGSGLIWRYWQLQKIVPTPKTRYLRGEFTMPDGTPGIVNAIICGNSTIVIIVVGTPPFKPVASYLSMFFGGASFCCPTDKFDINTGVRVACKRATQGWPNGKEVYFAIRKAMRESNK